MADEPLDLAIDLEPIDPSLLRSAEGTRVWETVRGKRNRVTIGSPRWLDPAGAVDAATMTRLLDEYPPTEYLLQALRLSLTLLPDRDCRFRSADIVLTLTDSSAGLSRFAHLEPREEVTTLQVTTERPGGHAALTIISAVEIGINTGSRRVESPQSEAWIEAFGTSTSEAGWRLSVTQGRDIPLDAPGLQAIIARPMDHNGRLHMSAVAEIDVLTVGDRWLTWAFKRSRPEVELVAPIPPGREDS